MISRGSIQPQLFCNLAETFELKEKWSLWVFFPLLSWNPGTGGSAGPSECPVRTAGLCPVPPRSLVPQESTGCSGISPAIPHLQGCWAHGSQAGNLLTLLNLI